MKHTKYLTGILSLILIAGSAGFAMAADYSPGSVILLNKGGDGKLSTPEEKLKQQKAKGKETISKEGAKDIGNGVSVYQNAPAIVVTPGGQSLNSSAQPEDKVTQAYAGHLFSGICAQGYRSQLAPSVDKKIDMKILWDSAMKSCQCLSTAVLSVTPASDLADYVMYVYGWQDPEKANLSVDAYRKSTKVEMLANLIADPRVRGKCGFIK